MKKIKLLGVLFSAFVLIQSCSSSSCYTCSMSILGISTDTKYCKGDANMTVTAMGQSTTVPSNGVDLETWKSQMTTAGYTCK